MALTRKSPRALSPAGTTNPREVAEVVNNTRAGRVDWVGEVTLTASAASTAVTDNRVTPDKAVLLMPLTANAAGALATSYIAEADIAAGSFTITHANNAQTDRTFRYLVVG